MLKNGTPLTPSLRASMASSCTRETTDESFTCLNKSLTHQQEANTLANLQLKNSISQTREAAVKYLKICENAGTGFRIIV